MSDPNPTITVGVITKEELVKVKDRIQSAVKRIDSGRHHLAKDDLKYAAWNIEFIILGMEEEATSL